MSTPLTLLFHCENYFWSVLSNKFFSDVTRLQGFILSCNMTLCCFLLESLFFIWLHGVCCFSISVVSYFAFRSISDFSHCMQQILESIGYCHQMDVAHRDLKVSVGCCFVSDFESFCDFCIWGESLLLSHESFIFHNELAVYIFQIVIVYLVACISVLFNCSIVALFIFIIDKMFYIYSLSVM